LFILVFAGALLFFVRRFCFSFGLTEIFHLGGCQDALALREPEHSGLVGASATVEHTAHHLAVDVLALRFGSGHICCFVVVVI
jgi:hypothetical protein